MDLGFYFCFFWIWFNVFLFFLHFSFKKHRCHSADTSPYVVLGKETALKKNRGL